MTFFVKLTPAHPAKKGRDRCKADSTLRTSRAVPHPSTNRAPTAVIFCDVADVESRSLYWQLHSSTTSHKPSPVRPLQLPMVCLIIKAPLSLFSRGESGWCSDVTSTHGAWRHAGIRFLLPGDRSSGMHYIQPEVKRSEFSSRRGA
jgi:hypothetical protein